MEKTQDKKQTNKQGKKPTDAKTPLAPNALVDQFKYLQQTIGNQEVQQLVQTGVLSPLKTYQKLANPKDEKLVKNASRKDKFEEKQIQADRAAVDKEALKLLKKKNEQLQAMVNKNPELPVYANVSIELVYAQPPGKDAGEFYHYTRLVEAVFSHKEIEKKGGAKKIPRGKVIPITYSFEYEPAKKLAAAKKAKDEKEKAAKAKAAKAKADAEAKKAAKAKAKGQDDKEGDAPAKQEKTAG